MSSSTQIIDEGAVHSDSALAAYATLGEGVIDQAILVRLGMTEAQATTFAKNNTVVAQAELVAGASATVFQDAEGKRYLSIRGTEPLDLRDLVGDTLIGLGVPVGANPQYWGLNSQVAEWISDGTLPQQFEVDGPSAGGYYGIALKQDFPQNITHAYIYNAPGEAGVLGNLAYLFGASPTTDPGVTIYTTAGGISLIAGLGIPAGVEIVLVPTENDWSHSQANLSAGLHYAADNGGSGVFIETYVPSLSNNPLFTPQTIGTLIDALTLLRAIQSGDPLPITVSGLRLANDVSNLAGYPSYNLSGAASLGSGILSLMSLNEAIKQGDTLAAMTAGAQTISFGAQAYVSFAASMEIPVSSQVAGSITQFNKALPYLNLVNSIAHGDEVGAAVAATDIVLAQVLGSTLYAVPYVGWAYAVYSIVDSLFGGHNDIPDPWGSGHYAWNGYGTTVVAVGETGGNEAVTNVMNSVLATMNALVERERQQNPGSQLGIIPNRMPGVAYDMSGYRYTDIDPLTGAEQHPYLRFDTSGNPYNAVAGTPESYQSIVEGMVYSALSRGAIAPLWEVQTAAIQTQYGDPKAGLTEEERAGRDGKLAAPLSGATQIFRPVMLDLDGDGIETVGKAASGVVFDVDDSGFMKQTGWATGGDAFLTLDRDYNGETNTGREMFSNSVVDISRRGLAGMAWVDSNYDGKLTAADPVWNELKVWFDDGDGVDEAGEKKTLAELGISELNYSMGTFTQNGQVKQLASPNLEADTEGTRVSVVPEGIILETSSGQTSLLVTRIDDLTAVEANRDGATGYEDIEMIIGSNDLLANDTLGGFLGRDLTITGLTNFKHGTGYLDANGFIHFIPEANYYGPDAGFKYNVLAINGQQGTGTVNLTLQGVNDAPTAGPVDLASREIYGYTTPILYDDNGYYLSGGNPIYQPYAFDTLLAGSYYPIVYNPPSDLGWDYQYCTTPVTYENNLAVYGQVPVHVTQSGDDGYSWSSIQYLPIYQPYAITMETYNRDQTAPIIYNPPSGVGRYDYHTTAVAYNNTGAGQVYGNDVDDPATSLTYQLVNQPQYGSVMLNANGTFQYTSWKEPGVPSDGIVVPAHSFFFGSRYRESSYAAVKDGILYDQYNLPPQAVYPTSDVFQVRITDPHGASTVQSITVPHYGPYLPPPPPGGGGGKKPIALDLNGNGFEFVNVDDSNVFFDVNGDGWKERTAWVAPGDGLLAYDADGNGKIEHADEISFVGYKADAQTDLEGLRAFDSNGDGIFSAADDKWSKFGVWQDTNQNGVTDPGEFRTLDEMGVASIALTSDGQFSVINGQTVHGVGTVTNSDGSTLAMADVTLAFSNQVQVTLPDGTTHLVERSPFSPSGEVLEGTAGNDLILGKNGNNIIKAYAGDDVIFEDGGNDIIDAGEGNDVVYAGADNDLVMGGVGDDAIYAGLGSDVVFGGDGNDAILAEGGNDVVFGGAGNDLISGGWGNDVLSGDDGDDQVYGEAGNDALFGRDGNDELAGMDGYDRLDGGAGHDLLDGGAGVDEMIGGAGDDIYVVDNVGDVVTENLNEGIDTVRSSIDYVLGANLENLTLTGSDNLTGTGNSLDNVITGNAGISTLIGGAGNDRLVAGSGAATMLGGTGNDTYVVNSASDVVSENPNEGLDTVLSSITYALTDNVENLALTGTSDLNGTGNALDNVITGNGGNNILDGGIGTDTMMGGVGNDIYIVDNANDKVVENANEGTDLIRSSVSYALSDNVENLTLVGTADINGTGNSLDNIITGNAGNNTLIGGEGNDRLIAGSGASIMLGGTGDDTYVVNSVGDLVIENPNEGLDAVLSSISYALTDNVENLELTGTFDINGTGNILDNVITGNGSSNILDGGIGADIMIGGAGNDTYIVDNIGDQTTEQANEGIDSVLSSISWTLADNVENLTLAGMTDLNGTGNVLDNVITGNSGNNILDGDTGADTMIGGDGNDTYIVDNVNDRIIENVNEGTDLVLSSVSYALSDNVENITLTGSDNLTATGNSLDNVITGNAGNDTLIGGAGNDTYIVNNSGDIVIENLGEGIDAVFASVSYALSDNVENLTLTGTADLNGTGNALDNVITGNSGNNVLDGGAGADILLGGAGNDTYIVDNINDKVIENANEGTELVFSSVSYALSDNVENLTLTGSSDINGTGNMLDNVITGNVGNNVLDGGAGADTMTGGSGNDTYVVENAGDQTIELVNGGVDTVLSSISWTLADNVENLTLIGNTNIDGTGNVLHNVINGNTGNNRLSGGVGNDELIGNGGNDYFDGGTDNDTLIGGIGNDTYIWRQSEGLDTIADAGGNDTVQFGAGLTLDNLALRVTSLDGVYTAHVRALNASGCEMDDQGLDFTVSIGADGKYTSPVEQFYLADGTVLHFNDLLIKTVVTTVNPQTRTVVTGRDDDIIYAGSTSDTIYSGTGNDIVYAFAARDTVYGGGGNDALLGGSGADTLVGGCGYNILAGGNGQDVLTAGDENNLFLGGNGSDQITAGAGNNLIAGGKQDDIITVGAGNNIISFNRGDARDTLFVAPGGHSALSLGGGLSYSDLSFTRSGNDLLLDASRGDAITIKNWYTSSANHSFVTLQMIEEASPDYAPTSSDSLRNSKVELFDFQKLVGSFDQASAANPKLSQWSLMNGLLDAHLSSSNSAAIGGEMAYEYGKTDSLAQVGVLAAETTLKAPGFGAMQTLKPFQGLAGDVSIGR